MGTKKQCSYCKHKQARALCGSPQSAYYNQTIQPTWQCDYFAPNPAQELVTKAIAKTLSENTSSAGIEDLKKAIELGLPQDDEMKAVFLLGEGYSELAGRIIQTRQLTDDQVVALPEFVESVNLMEKAVLTDRKEGYKFFLEPLNRSRTDKLDTSYYLIGKSLEEKQGVDAAIAYFQQKLGLVSYLPTTPFLRVLLALGNLYNEKGQKEAAVTCYKNVLSSDPVHLDEQGKESGLRQEAAAELSRLEPKTKPAGQSGCFIATAVYGSEDVKEIILLRQFRDKFLLPRAAGRGFVRAYNAMSPAIAHFILRSRILRVAARKLLVKPAVKVARIAVMR